MSIDSEIAWTWLIALIPSYLYIYLFFSYLQVVENKRNELQRVLSRRGESVREYVRAYGSQDDGPEVIAQRLLTRNNYSALSYLRAFAFASLLATIPSIVAVSLAGLQTGLPKSLVEAIRDATARSFLLAALAGCAGAFVWGLYELLRRYRIGDLTPSTIYYAAIRLLILAGVGPSLSSVLKAEFSWAIAFGLGVIPLNTVAEVAGEPTRRALKLSPVTPLATDTSFSWVDGLTGEVIERLNEAGVQSVQQLAYTDPLRLLVRTNLDWKVILDLVDQAFLSCYIGEKIQTLRSAGIRGAQELSDLDPANNEEVLLVSERVGISKESVKMLIRTLRGDPTTSFITHLW